VSMAISVAQLLFLKYSTNNPSLSQKPNKNKLFLQTTSENALSKSFWESEAQSW